MLPARSSVPMRSSPSPSRPVIIAQSPNQTAFPEQTVKFSVTAVGTQPLSYRWRQNGTNLSDSVDISGSSGSVLTLRNLTTSTAGTYSVAVSNGLASATNTGAVLTIVPLGTPGVALTTLIVGWWSEWRESTWSSAEQQWSSLWDNSKRRNRWWRDSISISHKWSPDYAFFIFRDQQWRAATGSIASCRRREFLRLHLPWRHQRLRHAF